MSEGKEKDDPLEAHRRKCEPNWVKLGTELPPVFFRRPKKGATLGYIRDGELFDAKWVLFELKQGIELLDGQWSGRQRHRPGRP